jgi:eukaryotic-like serine/threonine-protein kinase
VPSEEDPEIVIDQDPGGGTEVQQGDTVTLFVSSGPTETSTPEPTAPEETTPPAEPSPSSEEGKPSEDKGKGKAKGKKEEGD